MIETAARTVYCVIPVHNRLEITKRCLGYLIAQDYPNLHIVIVDDGSTDGTGEYLAQSGIGNLTVLSGTGDLWWGGSMHVGIEHVRGVARPSDYLLMMNDDVHFRGDYVSTLVAESAANAGAVVGSPQRDEATGRLLDCGYRLNYWSMRFEPIRAPGRSGSVNALPGRGTLVPMSAVLAAGNINARRFAHYLGDLEYTARIYELGWPIVVSGSADIYSSSQDSDHGVRSRGIAAEYLSWRSKNNLVQRLWFFTLRGPLWLRVSAVPRYLIVGGLRFCRRLL